jgi:hypothetical protein
LVLKKKYNYTSVYNNFNNKEKDRCAILKNNNHLNPKELEDRGHC